jgi:lysozyme family protein
MSEYVKPPTAPAQQPSGALPLPLQTVEWEGRKDKQGNLAVYKLPSGDMGGNYEVAGINDRYHPEAYKAISSLPPQERAKAAAEYIQGYTAPLVERLPQPLQPFTQDLAFNRGLGGATKYIQQGLNSLGQKVAVDGGFGPKTLAAINQVEPRALMRAASDAQLQDEYKRAELDPNRKKFIPGLEARIRNRLSTFGQG